MSRLIAFGCSFTWGTALPDESGSKHGDPIQISDLSWPALLSKSLNRELVNMAVPGGSNKRILQSIVEFDYQPTDIAIVMWTTPTRSTVFRKNIQDQRQYHVNSMADINDSLFFRIHHPYDLEYSDMLHIIAGTGFLRDQNIAGNIQSSIGDLWTIEPKWFESYRPKIQFSPQFTVDYALDQAHPGINSHQLMADQFLTIVSSWDV